MRSLLVIVSWGCGAKNTPAPAIEPPPAQEAPAPAPVDPASITLSVDLSELPEAEHASFASVLGLEAVSDRAVTIEAASLEALFARSLREILLEPALEALSFYEPGSYTRVGYWENVVVQLPDHVAFEPTPYEGYTRYEHEGDPLPGSRAHLIYRLDRSPAHLASRFAIVEPLLHEILDADTYERSSLGRHTRALLASHARVLGRPDAADVLADLHAQIQAQDADADLQGQRTYSAYPVYASLGLIDPDSGMNDTSEQVWFASFWLRRHLEGNTDAVHTILEKIDRRYGRPTP